MSDMHVKVSWHNCMRARRPDSRLGVRNPAPSLINYVTSDKQFTLSVLYFFLYETWR